MPIHPAHLKPATLAWRDAGHCLSLGFGTGLIPFAPGTWGTLLAVPFLHVLWGYTNTWSLGLILAAATLLGIPLCQRTGRALGVPDHGSIVWDEIVAFGWVLWLIGPDRPWLEAISFVLFRAFDILKPPPIHLVDQYWKNGLGVMLDDLIAAFYTLLSLAILVLIQQQWSPELWLRIWPGWLGH